MCHVWPVGWIRLEITIIMCYVPSKLTILSKRSRPKENLKCQTKFEAAERIMMMQAVNLVRALKCFLLRWSLNTAVPLRVEFFCDFWCSVWSRPVSRPKWTQRRQRSACRLVFAKSTGSWITDSLSCRATTASQSDPFVFITPYELVSFWWIVNYWILGSFWLRCQSSDLQDMFVVLGWHFRRGWPLPADRFVCSVRTV